MKRTLQAVAAMSSILFFDVIVDAIWPILCVPNVSTVAVNMPFVLFSSACIFVLVGVVRFRYWARRPAMALLGASSALGLLEVYLVWHRPHLFPPTTHTAWSLTVIHVSAATWVFCLVLLLIVGNAYHSHNRTI